MANRCVSGCRHVSVIASHHQTQKPCALRCCNDEGGVKSLWIEQLPRPSSRTAVRWPTFLGATGIAFAAAVPSRRRTNRHLVTVRSAEQHRAETANTWFQSQLEFSQTQPLFDKALSQQGVAILERMASPMRQQEPWRYTDVDALLYAEKSLAVPPPAESLRATIAQMLEDQPEGAARLVFIDGKHSTDFSHLQSAANGPFIGGGEALRSQSPAIGTRVTELLRALPEVDICVSSARDALGCAKLAALNQASFEDCAICFLEDDRLEGFSTPVEVQVVFITTGSSRNECSSPRFLIDVGRNRRLHVVETHLSLNTLDTSLSNGICRVLLAEGSDVRHDIFQQRAGDARFVESLTAEVSAKANYDLRIAQTGSLIARLNVAVILLGRSASCEVSTTMIAGDKQQLDLHSLIHHAVPGCRSKQQHKNIVADMAECIFKGSIRVDKEAQRTDSSQICRSLLLSKKAKVKAMPSLQIRADDVSCSHGAAVTELDTDQLFYLASRGLEGTEARRLLLTAFPQDLLGGLQSAAPKNYSRVLAKLESIAGSRMSPTVIQVSH